MLHYYCVVLSNMDVSVLLQQMFQSVKGQQCVEWSMCSCQSVSMFILEGVLDTTTTTASTTNLCWCHTCRIVMQQNIQQYKDWIKLD